MNDEDYDWAEYETEDKDIPYPEQPSADDPYWCGSRNDW